VRVGLRKPYVRLGLRHARFAGGLLKVIIMVTKSVFRRCFLGVKQHVACKRKQTSMQSQPLYLQTSEDWTRSECRLKTNTNFRSKAFFARILQ